MYKEKLGRTESKFPLLSDSFPHKSSAADGNLKFSSNILDYPFQEKENFIKQSQ